jgi:hypothetical protein
MKTGSNWSCAELLLPKKNSLAGPKDQRSLRAKARSDVNDRLIVSKQHTAEADL